MGREEKFRVDIRPATKHSLEDAFLWPAGACTTGKLVKVDPIHVNIGAFNHTASFASDSSVNDCLLSAMASTRLCR